MPPTADVELQRFAWRVAGPRDFVINVCINGTIAWFVFGGATAVPLSGTASIFDMLLPMFAIESTLTSFFGVLNGLGELRKRQPPPGMAPLSVWLVRTIGDSLWQGAAGLGTAYLAMRLVAWSAPRMTISPLAAVAAIALISGTLAFLLHSRAVLQAPRLTASR